MNQSTRGLGGATILLLFLAVVVVPLVFIFLQPARGFQDPESARIVVVHVPLAWLATLGFIVSAVYAVRYLKRRALGDDDASAAAAEIGLLCCILATVTGSIFAKSQWGSWWNWDPRETSIFFLLLIYGAYFSLRGSVDDPVRRAVFSAAYALLAFLVMPFLVFVLPRITNSLHPSRARLDGTYWLVLLVTFFGFASFLTWVFRTRCALGRARLAALDSEPGSSVSLHATVIKRDNGNAASNGGLV